jgi:hypothetical protein
MKRLWLIIILIRTPLPTSAASDTTAFYYAECLQNAAIVNAMPNADGSLNDHNSMLDPSNPELNRFCTNRALEKANTGVRYALGAIKSMI